MHRLSRRTLMARAGAAGAALVAAQVPGGLLDPREAAAASRLPATWTRELMDQLRGGVYLPDNPRYYTAQAVYNSRYDLVFPPVIARPLDTQDVRTAVAWAARHDIPIVPRGGGHGYTGNATSGRGLVIDLRSLKTVAAFDGRQRAQIGGGALAIDVIASLAPLGATVPTGTCPSVGVTGLALGGGVGPLGRAHGLTTDRLESLTIVTPDGVVRTASETENPDLFWACRGGGGGNLGVVTDAVFRTVPTVMESHVSIQWSWPFADDALDAFLRSAPDATRALTGDLAFSVDSSRGWPVVRYTGAFQGSPDDAAAAVKELAEVGDAQVSIAPVTHLAAAKASAYCSEIALEQCRPNRFGAPGLLGRSRFFAGSSYVDEPLDASGRQALLRAVRTATPVFSGRRSVILTALGGAIADVDPGATAYPHREARCSVQFLARSSGWWEDYNARNWVRSSRNHLAPYATGGAYVNYLDRDQAGWQQAYYGDSLERLKAAKAVYDPDGRFQPAQGIPLPA